MSSRWRVPVVGAVLMGITWAGASSASTPVPAAAEVAPHAQVYEVEGAPECGGAGHILIHVPSVPGPVCVSDERGALPADIAAGAPTGSSSKKYAKVKPVCYGDGQTGPRVQFIYGVPEGFPNRAKTFVPFIRNEMAWRMEAVIKGASAGRDLSWRFLFETGCKQMQVDVVTFPSSVMEGDEGDKASVQFGRIIQTLVESGYDRNDRKYHVLWDGWTSQGVCGLGQNARSYAPTAINPQNGLPTAGGYIDLTQKVAEATGQRPVGSQQYSITWKHIFSPNGPSCYEADKSGAGVQIHEIFHSLGAVQPGSPNHDDGGHCTDKPSVMCNADSGGIPPCQKSPVQVLDCGQDDYWHPNPAPDSPMSRVNNIALGQYFGPEPQDGLAGSPALPALDHSAHRH